MRTHLPAQALHLSILPEKHTVPGNGQSVHHLSQVVETKIKMEPPNKLLKTKGKIKREVKNEGTSV
jgi:hypothetical protein